MRACFYDDSTADEFVVVQTPTLAATDERLHGGQVQFRGADHVREFSSALTDEELRKATSREMSRVEEFTVGWTV